MAKLTLAIPCALVLLSGCEALDTLTADKPNATQREGIAGVLAHYKTAGAVFGDPATASDGDFEDLYDVEPYFQLLDPSGTMPIPDAVSKAARLAFDPSCVNVDGQDATWDCDVSFRSRACHVAGSGSELAEGNYAGESTLTGATAPCSFGLDVVGAFTLVSEGPNASASGTLSINQGGPNAFGFDAELENLSFCADGLPNGGRIRVTGTGLAATLPFSPITIRFTGDACGFAVIE